METKDVEETMTNDHIKTGDDIWSDVEYSGADNEPIDKKWVSLTWICDKIREGHLSAYYSLLLQEENESKKE